MSYSQFFTFSNTDQIVINPAKDETVILLRNLVRLLSPIGVVDSLGRQRIVCCGLGNATANTNNLLISGSPDANTAHSIIGVAVSNANGPNAANTTQPAPGQGLNLYQNVWEGPVDQRWRVINSSHITYANGIRANLSNS